MTRGWTGLRTSVIALGMVAAVAVFAPAPARGDATPAGGTVQSLMQYSTAGAIGTTGISGPNVISFNSIPNGVFTASSNPTGTSNFSLGEFVVAPLPDGQSTVYNNTPFRITYLTDAVGGQTPVPNDTPIQLTGVLNGTVTGSSVSTVVATFNNVNSSFQTGSMLNALTTDNARFLVPSTNNGGLSTAEARDVIQPIPLATPEPTSVAVFLTAITGLGLRRRLRKGPRA